MRKRDAAIRGRVEGFLIGFGGPNEAFDGGVLLKVPAESWFGSGFQFDFVQMNADADHHWFTIGCKRFTEDKFRVSGSRGRVGTEHFKLQSGFRIAFGNIERLDACGIVGEFPGAGEGKSSGGEREDTGEILFLGELERGRGLQ